MAVDESRTKLPSEVRKQIGERHAQIRKEKGVTQQGLADAVSKPAGSRWHYTYVGNVERGQHAPSQAYLVAVGEYLHVAPDAFLPEGLEMDSLHPGTERTIKRGGSRRLATVLPLKGAREPDDVKVVKIHLNEGRLTITTSAGQTAQFEDDMDARIEDGQLILA